MGIREKARRLRELRRAASRRAREVTEEEILELDDEEPDALLIAARRRKLPPLSRPEDWMPFPEIVGEPGDPFEIHDSNDHPALGTSGAVDLIRRVMMTRLDPQGRSTSLHELAHVLLSPPKMPRSRVAHPQIVLAVEDARINSALRNVGLGHTIDEPIRDHVMALARRDLDRGDVGAFVVRATASIGTGIEDGVAALGRGHADPRICALPGILGEVADKLEAARARRGTQVASWRQGLAVARWLQRELARHGITPADMPRGIGIACCAGVGRGGGRPFPFGARPGSGEENDVRPGRMTIARPTLSIPCAPAAVSRARKGRPSAEGVEFRYVERFATDQRVFRDRRRRRAEGACVLVDVSGSMSLGRKEVERIIESAPGATLVALYSGRGAEGELRIVVENGRRAADTALEPYGSGNIVDLPALEWLARQSGYAVRLWLTDGGVTGVGDEGSAEIERACKRVCRRAGIKQVGNAEAAARAIARGARAA